MKKKTNNIAKQIYHESLSQIEVLNLLSKNKITAEEANQLISKIAQKEETPLCNFSGSGSNPNRPTRACSRTDGSYKGNCATCRVAAEWEEAYG